MADTTWGVKVPEEMKEKITKLMQESGLSGKEFVESMLQSYTIKEMKENQTIMAPDLEELQVVTNRIVGIYTNLGERLSNMIADKENYFNIELEKKEKTINTFGEKISALESSLADANTEKNEANNYALELKKQQKDMEDSLETHKALVIEYKEKNDTLTGMLTDYNDQKKKLEQLREELAIKETDVQQVAFQLEGTRKEIEVLDNENKRVKTSHQEAIDKLKAAHQEAIEKLQITHQEALERTIEKMDIEKKSAVLEIRADYQNKIEEVSAKSSDHIEALLAELQIKRTVKKPTDKAKIEKK